MAKAVKSKIRLSRQDKIYLGVVRFFLGIFVAIVLYPLIYVISCSFSSPEALVAGKVFLFPVEFGIQGYKAVFANQQIGMGYIYTIYYTVVGTLTGTAVTLIGAFVLSRKEFPFRKIMTALITVTMFFSGGIMPLYILIKDLHMLNTVWALVLPGCFSVWMAIIGRTFLQSTIPEDLFEATNIDGGNYFHFLIKIVLPLSKPIIAVIALNFAVGNWNSYFNALMFLTDSEKYPLQLILKNILIQNTIDPTSLNSVDAKSMMERQYLAELLKYSLIIVSSVPLLIVYPFIQKYFVKGVMVGSIKG